MLGLIAILFGSAFTLLACYGIGAFLLRKFSLPNTIVFGVGAAVLSHVVFLLVLCGIASPWSFLPVGVVAVGAAAVHGRRRANHWPKWPIAVVILAGYGLYYLVQALAPEILADGYTYHLGLPREWLRLGGFSGRIGFFETVGQGMEMLFAFAYAFGKHSAAKLVHFAFLVATVPLLGAVGRRLGLPDWAGAAAAVFYVCAPVVGKAGTAAYTDAALVFFILATFYLLLAWEQDGDDRILLAAGITAGFCYPIKFTGIIVAPLAVAWVLARWRWKAAAMLTATAALMIAPWLIRNAVWTGNPFAPVFNDIFRNPYFHVWSEKYLANSLRTYDGVPRASMPLELTVYGQRLQGLVGPVFLLAPLALIGLRHRAGRLLLAAGLLMWIPWWFNAGARFLMPALVFVAFAMAASLPRRLVAGLVVAHAVLSIPPVVGWYAKPGAWRLESFPLAAALRMESESNYLERVLWEYRVAEMVDTHIPAGERFLDLVGLPGAYMESVPIVPWQSAAGDRVGYGLSKAVAVAPGLWLNFRSNWPPQELTAIRIQQTGSSSEQWGVNDIQLLQGTRRVALRNDWRLLAMPNVWEAGYAFDRNLASRWGSWEALRPGMYVGAEFPEPLQLTGVNVFCLTVEQPATIEVYGHTPDGEWRLLDPEPPVERLPAINLRRSAMSLLGQMGIRYVAAPTGENFGYGPLGRALAERPGEWGVEMVEERESAYLYRLR